MIDFGFLSLNLLTLIIVFLILLFCSFKFGKKLIYALIIALYPAIYILDYFPYVNIQTQNGNLIVFLILYLLLIFAFWKNLNPRDSHKKIPQLFDFVILIFSYILLLTAITQQFLPALNKILIFSDYINNLVSGLPYGVTLLLPIIAILITTKRGLY